MGDTTNDEIMAPVFSPETRSKHPKPHSVLFHPDLTISEKIASTVISVGESLVGANGLMGNTDGIGNSKQQSRDRFSQTTPKIRDGVYEWLCRRNLTRWSTVASSASSSPCLLAESTGFLPFRKNILQEWNIVDDHTVLPDVITASDHREGVKIIVRFPSSLLSSDKLPDQGTILDYSGCLEVDFDSVDWRTFAPDVPMIVTFHGGGMTVGHPHDPFLLKETSTIVQNAPKGLPNDVITMSVDYGLAPKDPFPLGIMDALSVIDYLLKDNTNSRKSIHITGMSAGGNVSLVAGLEGFRRFPGRISSIQSQSPFLNPAGDSISYYMHRNVCPSIHWLRWCWRVYLGLEKPNDDDDDDDNNNNSNESKLEQVLRKGSNYSSWNAWKATRPSRALHRLVNPGLGIPEGLDCENAPTIIVRYNRGDPLYADGKVVAEALKQKAGKNFYGYEETGLHVNAAGPYDESAPKDYWKVWSEAIFGDYDSGK